MRIQYKTINHNQREKEQTINLDTKLEVDKWLLSARKKQNECNHFSYIEVDSIYWGQNRILDAFYYIENRNRILKSQQ